jgi:UDP-N-acetylmuramoyl-L-alanyl-D-glutamate--2,6-diaminopimelate ligase
MTLLDLLTDVEILESHGALDVRVPALRFDSRQVEPGDTFVALRGVQVDGHKFIEKAIEKGAAAIVAADLSAARDPQVTAVRVADPAGALGLMADRFYGQPSHGLELVGITGTNGKTTTATLLHQLFTRLGYRAGLIGTVENRIGERTVPSTHTTPDAVQLHALLREMADAGCTQVFMEVSSHAVEQRRIAGVHVRGAVFTNITQDHLDYHGTFAAYRDAKKKFFDDLPATAFALTNADDRNGAFMLQNTRARKYTYSLRTMADFKTRILENALTGLYLQLDGEPFHARMIGEFNAYNLTAVYAAARLLGAEKIEVLTALSDLRGAEGRFEYLVHPVKTQCIAIVDYAHTPDALEKVLETIRSFKPRPSSKVITVVGCGGDRDRTKRPVMARTAARYSEQVVLTSDNPRSEAPDAILREMEAGLEGADLKKTLIIENREQAIKTACRLADAGDIILVAGKGHEKYQEINGVKYPFDDKEVLLKEFGLWPIKT